MTENQQIIQELNNLKKEVKQIKERMVDIDSILTEDDYEALLTYRKEKKAGKLVSHDQLKKELGL